MTKLTGLETKLAQGDEWKGGIIEEIQYFVLQGEFGMYRIALCDDELNEIDKMEKILDSYVKQHTGCDFSIERFSDSEELLWMIKEKDYMPDLLFMDIYMPGRLGIEAAKELREMGIECSIIFLTTSREYALEAFGVDATQYLVKPVNDSDIFRLLDKFIKEMKDEESEYLLFNIGRSVKRIEMHDIVYCEAYKKQQFIYLEDGTEVLQGMTMTRLCEILSGYEKFARVGVSYIINLEHVAGINIHEIDMDNGQKIYMPRGAYKTLRDQYFNYYCKDVE